MAEDKLPYPPLKFPDQWPIKDHWLNRINRWIPVLGWIVYGIGRRFVNQQKLDLSYRFEQQLWEQLHSSPHESKWIPNRSGQIVYDCLAEAICCWKNLEYFTGHPDDPLFLIFWATDEDLSPVDFHLNLQKRFGFSVPNMLREIFLNNSALGNRNENYERTHFDHSKATLQDLINTYAHWIDQQESLKKST